MIINKFLDILLCAASKAIYNKVYTKKIPITKTTFTFSNAQAYNFAYSIKLFILNFFFFRNF